MEHNHIVDRYQVQLLSLFKMHFKKMALKNPYLNFQSVVQEVIHEIGFEIQSNCFLSQAQTWFNQIQNMSFIHPLLLDFPEEIIIHSSSVIQLKKGGVNHTHRLNGINEEDWQLSLELLAMRSNITWNYSKPFASFTIELQSHHFRATLIHYSTTSQRISKLFLRVIKSEQPSTSWFNLGSELNLKLQELIHQKKNILISGSTGSGKTTFMNALINLIDPIEHIISLEDVAELKYDSLFHTSLIAEESTPHKSFKDYCAYALRMSPNRIMIGEMRSAEVVPFILAMNTGHRGLMSTIHADSCVDALLRVSLLFSIYAETKQLDYKLILKLVCKNIDYVIHMEDKKIKQLSRVIGSEGENPFYEIEYQI